MCSRVCVYFPVSYLVLVFIVHFKCSTYCLVNPGVALLVPLGYIVHLGPSAVSIVFVTPMSGKRQKLPTKRGRASEDPTSNFDVSRFVKKGVVDRFGTICKNQSFIKEKGFHHPDDFFLKTIAAKGWRALFQPPRPAAMSVVREFYANLTSHVVKKVRVRGVLVDFSAESINQFYNLDPVPPEPFYRLYEQPDYPEVIRVLTNGRGEWKLNNDGHAVHFKAKHLAYIPKVWHHFITSRLIPTTTCVR